MTRMQNPNLSEKAVEDRLNLILHYQLVFVHFENFYPEISESNGLYQIFREEMIFVHFRYCLFEYYVPAYGQIERQIISVFRTPFSVCEFGYRYTDPVNDIFNEIMVVRDQ